MSDDREVADTEQRMQRDHAHPNADGARRIADNIWPYLLQLVEKTPELTR